MSENDRMVKLRRWVGFLIKSAPFWCWKWPASSHQTAKKGVLLNGDRQKIKHAIIALGAMFLIMFGGSPAAASKKLILPKDKGIIVLDPGHGGNDTGARSADGIDEKAVTLNMAHMIAKQLKDDYQVVLTRTDDYWLDIPSRTSVANHMKAGLFISLHAGGSFLHSAGGTSVFYYESPYDWSLTVKKPDLDPLADADSPSSWNHVQEKYVSNSRKLAEIIQSQIFKITQDPDSNIQGAALAVLKGADMPAVLIELGYLTNPNESKALVDPDFLALMADAISKGIKAFLSEKGK